MPEMNDIPEMSFAEEGDPFERVLQKGIKQCKAIGMQPYVDQCIQQVTAHVNDVRKKYGFAIEEQKALAAKAAFADTKDMSAEEPDDIPKMEFAEEGDPFA